MTLASELDVLLATARELTRARQDAQQQIGHLETALVQARDGLKHTNALAAQIARRLRVLATRQGLLPPGARADSLDLSSLAAQTAQALAACAERASAPNVVALRPPATPASAPQAAETADASDLPRVLRDVLGSLDERDARVLRLVYGITRHAAQAPDGSGPLSLMAVANMMGLRPKETVDRFLRALAKLRHPSRADRLRPLFIGLDARQAVSGEAGLLRAVFTTRSPRD